MKKTEASSTKKHIIQKKFKFEDHKPCLEATQLENKIKQLEKYKVDVDSVREKRYNS